MTHAKRALKSNDTEKRKIMERSSLSRAAACLFLMFCCLLESGCSQTSTSSGTSESTDTSTKQVTSEQISTDDDIIGKWQLVKSSSTDTAGLTDDTNGYLSIKDAAACIMSVDAFEDGSFIGKCTRSDNYYVLTCNRASWVGSSGTLDQKPGMIFVDSNDTKRIAIFDVSSNLLGDIQRMKAETAEKKKQFDELVDKHQKSNVGSSKRSYDLSTYQGIHDKYCDLMSEAAPRLAQEYNSEVHDDINDKAKLCNEKVAELAKINEKGTEKMAELRLKKGDSYSTYEDWAKKLFDAYQDYAKQIQDAYMSGAS